MIAYFSFGSEDNLTLKAFTATAKGTKATIRIELETNDMSTLGYALERLGAVQSAQKQDQKVKTPMPLSLPSPETYK